MYAEIVCPDGTSNLPMCDDSIIWPLATVTCILLTLLQGCTLDKDLISLRAMYIPEQPESALAEWAGVR